MTSHIGWSKRLIAIVALAATIVLIPLWYYASRFSPIPQRVLRIGFEQNPPFQARTDHGFGGIAVEVLNEAARRAGLRLQWIETGTSSEEAFRRGLVDLWPLMADLPERHQYIHFTRPWLHGNHILMLRGGSQHLERDFDGQIGLFKLPLHTRLLRSEFPKAQQIPLADAKDVVSYVCSGRVAAGFLEKLVAVQALEESPPECAHTTIHFQPLQDLTLQTAVASTFEAAGAADLLRQEIGTQFRDGTLAVTLAKYSFYGLDESWSTYELLENAYRERTIAWGTGALVVVIILALWQAIYLRQRRRAEIILRESEERFRAIFHQAGVGVAELSLDGRVKLANDRYCEVVGYSKQELDTKGTLDITHRDDLKEEAKLLPRLLAGEVKSFITEKRYARKDGSTVWATLCKSLVRDAAGKPKCLLTFVEDITKRKEAEASLKESEERFRHMADSAPVMIWVAGTDKLCTFFNQSWLTFTGRTLDEELGNGWAAGVYPEDLDRCLAIYTSAFDARREFKMEYRLQRADGEYRWVLDHGIPRFADGSAFLGYIGSCIDITDLKLALEESLNRQKLESLGVLTGGISHYFNNLLGGILVSAELIASDIAEGMGVDQEQLRKIQSEALRGGEIVRQLLIYSGEESHTFESIDIARSIRDMLPLLNVSIGKWATLVAYLPETVPAIQANPTQIRQVIMNLVTNASEALGNEPGIITITLENATSRPDSNLQGLDRNDYIRLEVSDSGSGMTEEVRARIFDPFFTTKFAGRGLGLATVMRIVLNHGGAIEVQSTPAKGSRFEIWLPCRKAVS